MSCSVDSDIPCVGTHHECRRLALLPKYGQLDRTAADGSVRWGRALRVGVTLTCSFLA